MRSRADRLHSSLRQLMKLLSQTELFNDSAVTLDVCLLKVAEKISSVTYHLLQTSAAVMVLVVGLEVLGKVLDPVCEERDLHLGRTCIALVSSVSLNNCLLFVLLHHGCFHLSKIYLSLTQRPAGELPPEATAYPKPVLTTCTVIISHLVRFVNSFFKFFGNF